MKFQLIIVLFLCSFFYSGHLMSQEPIKAEEQLSVNAGVGFPGLFHLGFKALSDQHELGLNLGVAPKNFQNAFAVSVDYYYHFAGSSKLTARKPYYFRAGLTYLNADNLTYYYKIFAFNPRIGRDFNISSNFGLQVDVGPSIFFYNQDFDSSGPRVEESRDLGHLFMSLSIGVFYKV